MALGASGLGYNHIEIENALSGTHGVTNTVLNGESFDLGNFSFEKTTANILSVQMY